MPVKLEALGSSLANSICGLHNPRLQSCIAKAHGREDAIVSVTISLSKGKECTSQKINPGANSFSTLLAKRPVRSSRGGLSNRQARAGGVEGDAASDNPGTGQ